MSSGYPICTSGLIDGSSGGGDTDPLPYPEEMADGETGITKEMKKKS